MVLTIKYTGTRLLMYIACMYNMRTYYLCINSKQEPLQLINTFLKYVVITTDN